MLRAAASQVTKKMDDLNVRRINSNRVAENP